MRRSAVLARLAPPILLAGIFLAFGLIEPAFFSIATVRNVLVQSSSVAIVAVGMTFVLIAGGIDLSVGAAMFLAAAVAGRLATGSAEWPIAAVIAVVVAVGLAFGAVNAGLVVGLRIAPFVATLATLFIGRGLSLSITETRAMNLPPSVLMIGRGDIVGVPMPVALMAAAAILGQVVLARFPFGRQLFALGHNAESARKAGLPVRRSAAGAYLICGVCAVIGGLVAVAQLGAVSPTFGYQREFAAIAAAVLGGTSLSGGRGSALPGAVLGALLVQTVETGLNTIDADPYAYPVVVGTIVFLAALIDRLRAT